MTNEIPSAVAAEIQALIMELEEQKKQIRDLQIVVASILNK
jgi:hypothetical protein